MHASKMTDMNTVLLVAHAPLAQAMRVAALHVFADLQNVVAAVDILPQATLQDSQKQVLQAWQTLQAVPNATGTLVLVDVVGATPCNVAVAAIQSVHNTMHNARLLTGMSLPMLLKVLNHLHEPLDTLLENAQIGARQGIFIPSVSTTIAATVPYG